MIKKELTPEEALQYWMTKKDTTFICCLFETIDKANLTQLEKLRDAFPEHVRVFEEAVSKQNPGKSKEEIEYLNLSFSSPIKGDTHDKKRSH